MKVREELEDPSVVRKIRDILTPKEFTRVDEIIELVFSTAEEAKQEDEIETEVVPGSGNTAKVGAVAFREDAVLHIEGHLKLALVKRSPAIYSSPDETTAVCCLISKSYQEKTSVYFWFGFRRSQLESLKKYPAAFVAFCCGSEDNIALVPLETVERWLSKLTLSPRRSSPYWHVHLKSRKDKLSLVTKTDYKDVDITVYVLKGRR